MVGQWQNDESVTSVNMHCILFTIQTTRYFLSECLGIDVKDMS